MTAAPAYPMHWEADVVLRDGATVHLRPINPQDAELLAQFHDNQSPESIYLRFFAPMPHLSARDIYHFTNVDHRDRVALVCTLADAIVGIARYDRLDERSAEVAFNVSDPHHGRGVSSVLLEHLAAAARENGVHEFVAEVLPHNRKMLTVFRQAGYEVVSRFDDGVIVVHFDLDPTERSLAVMEAREHRAESRSMERLLNPRSVAVIGASRRTGTVGHRLLSDLLAGGFTGRLHVVHPEADVVLGVPAVRSLTELTEPVDLAVIAVPADGVLDVVRDCAVLGVRGVLVVSSGFAETGPLGLARQRELVRVARANGLRVVGPNSWGLINAAADIRLNVSLVPELPAGGRLGLFSQSGGLSVAVLDAVARRGLGVSTFLSAGNRADVSGNDCMQYWEEDPETDAVCLYLESFGNPRKFSRIARRLARSKPVIVLKSSGYGVPPGHSVRPSIAPREAFDSMLKQSGCIRVQTLNHMLDVAQLVLNQPLPGGNRVGIVGNSDALGTLIADACVSWGLEVSHGPVALHPQAGPEEFHKALTSTFAADLDAVVAAFIPPIATDAAEVAKVLAEVSGHSAVPVVACFLGTSGMSRPDLGAIPSYPTPEEAVRALATAQRYAAWRKRDPGTRVEPSGLDLPTAHELVAEALQEADPIDGITLDPVATGRLLAAFGITLWPQFPVDSQRTPAPGVACVIRSVEDPSFGPVVSFGLGGDASELLGDVAHRIPPLTDVDIADLVRSVRAAPKLFGHHGAAPADVPALEDLLGRVACLADELPEVAELELNPVVVAGEGLSVLAATIRLAHSAERSDTARRELSGG